MGIITAAALAANYPELVRAAVLEDPPLRSTDDDLDRASRERDAAAQASVPRFSSDAR